MRVNSTPALGLAPYPKVRWLGPLRYLEPGFEALVSPCERCNIAAVPNPQLTVETLRERPSLSLAVRHQAASQLLEVGCWAAKGGRGRACWARLEGRASPSTIYRWSTASRTRSGHCARLVVPLHTQAASAGIRVVVVPALRGKPTTPE